MIDKVVKRHIIVAKDGFRICPEVDVGENKNNNPEDRHLIDDIDDLNEGIENILEVDDEEKLNLVSEKAGVAEDSVELRLKEMQERLEKAEKEVLYVRAEFDNYRKKAIKERSDLIKYGPERMACQLLDVLDILHTALEMELTDDNIKSFQEGVQMTAKQMNQVFEDFGIKKMESLGLAFNPQMHDALSSEEIEGFESGMISRVFKEAYKFHDKIIRPAQVVVAK